MAESQGELFPNDDFGNARLWNWKRRQQVIGQILKRWDRENRARRETKAEHEHAENGGTDYMKNAFREV